MRGAYVRSCGVPTSECTILCLPHVMLIFRHNIINPNEPGVERVQYPVNANWLKGVALRDLALHERHAACVDARGDVYQWGDGFFGSRPTTESEARGPKLTLRGQVRRISFRESIVTQYMHWLEHHPASAHGISSVCFIGLGNNFCLHG